MQEIYRLLVLESRGLPGKIYTRAWRHFKASTQAQWEGGCLREASGKQASSVVLLWLALFPTVCVLFKLFIHRCKLVISFGLIMENEEFWIEILPLFYCMESLNNILIQIRNRFRSMRTLDFFCLLNSATYDRYNKDIPENSLKPWRFIMALFFI